MRIGPMRHPITIQERSTAQDADYGEEARTLSNIAVNPNVWAEVLPAGGQERYVAGAEQVQAILTHRVRIRWRSDLSVEMIVVWESRLLEIQSIEDPSGKRQYLILKCREVTV